MRVIEGEDVNELYWRGMNVLSTDGVPDGSRNGPVLVMEEPVCSVYRKPRQRVLLDVRRGANPFFHLYESLWMLAGRDDVASLNRFITDFGTRFAEPDGRIHGAYGHRWRHALGVDQLDCIVHKLIANPRDRQCVLQMWDGTPSKLDENGEPREASNDLMGDWKDRPCNTHVYFRVQPNKSGELVLDMLVSCRSNDVIFGAYGANAVHFSILLEYMAGRIGVEVGTMRQLSFNYHAYDDVMKRIGLPSSLETYKGHELKARRMGTDWNNWDKDLSYFMSWHKALVEAGVTDRGGYDTYHNTWFRDTAEPMFIAHFKWKNAMHREAMSYAEQIAASDWRFAALQWFNLRSNPRSR